MTENQTEKYESFSFPTHLPADSYPVYEIVLLTALTHKQIKFFTDFVALAKKKPTKKTTQTNQQQQKNPKPKQKGDK